LQAAADIDKKIQELDARIDVLNEDVLNLRKEEQELIRTVDKIDLMIKTAQSRAERVKKATGKDQALIESLKSKQQRLKQIQKQVSMLVKKDSELALQLSTADNKLSLKKDQLAKIKARAEVSQSLNDAIKAVLKKPGVYGTISQLGSVSKEHALALQIAAGSRINDVVVQSAEVASKLIEYLRKEKIGVCSFIPLKEIKPPEISAQVKSLEKTPGVVGLAINLVRFDKKFEKAFQYVFGDSIIVKDLQVAKKLGVGSGLRMITLEGDLIEKSGRMRGGFRKHKKSGFVISSDNLQDVSKIEAEVSDLQSVIARLSSERKQVNEELQSLRLEQAKLEAEINATEKQVMLSIEDLEATKVEISKLNKELKEKQKLLEDLRLKIRDKLLSIARLKQEKSKLRDELKSLRSPTALAELSAFEEELKTVNTEIAEFNANLKALINEKDNLLKPELERVEKLLHNLNKDVENFKLEKKKLLETLKQDKKLLKELETQERSLIKRFKSLFDKRAQISDLIAKKELMIAELSNKITSQEARINASSIDIARLKAELSGLEEEFKPFKGVELLKGKTVEELKVMVRNAEQKLESFGAVNLRALEVYEQARNELQVLTEKLRKLEQERQDVLLMINEIDSKKRDIFLKTYEALNKNFKATFKLLSTKGEAFLELENPKNPFEGGVLVKVRLKGTKFLDVRSLSGGEKTLTALAFIFAVQEFEPAFFYVFDEVDSALDKKNSEKLSLLIKDYSRTAQYIIITHNDALIEQADVLFGVSIDENGVSKVTSIKLED
ncbi:chromosome segregation protein SMC, partial [Candidatus Woesearchaeota archaeon]|nr:chromosome segregation protein SMC [Candidatus Woesearchaeota archaeon]